GRSWPLPGQRARSWWPRPRRWPGCRWPGDRASRHGLLSWHRKCGAPWPLLGSTSSPTACRGSPSHEWAGRAYAWPFLLPPSVRQRGQARRRTSSPASGFAARGKKASGCLIIGFVAFLRRNQVALDFRRLEKIFDLLRFGEGLVFEEAQVGREFGGDHVPHLAAEKSLVTVERGDHGPGILAAQGRAIHRGIAHVGRRLDLGDGDGDPVQLRIANLVPAQNVRKRMAQHLAHAQLALRGT